MPQIKFTFTFEEPDVGLLWKEEDLGHHAQALTERIEHSAVAKVVGTHIRTEDSKVILDVETDESAGSLEQDIKRYDGAPFTVQSG